MKPIYTMDIETDPFLYGRDPEPFVIMLYDGTKDKYFWGKNCIARMHAYLQTIEPGIIFVHNGGRFDIFYCMDWIANSRPIMWIGGRIIKADLWRNDGQFHEFRDSLAIMPFALSKYKKDEIDYNLFEREVRDKHKKKIVSYLRGDCVYLHELCVSFFDRFGDNLTIGSTSMKELRKVHKFERLDEMQDAAIRGKYYYGGRVQCFEKGIVKPSQGERITCYDINQAYPYCMANFLHPIGTPNNVIGNRITDRTYFLTVRGRNHNALPVRTDDGLRFNIERGTFTVTIHEYKAAIETGLFECEDIVETVDFDLVASFDTFVDKFHALRKEAQLNGDKIGALFYKFVCNSAYGKFAQSPENYFNYMVSDVHTNLNPNHDPKGFIPCTLIAFANYILWKQPSQNTSRYNVATGASITGATRSLLIRALARAKRPLYCDTDCVISEGLNGVPFSDTALGSWKVEATGNKFAIAGRKMYALFSDKCPDCKGSRNSPYGICLEPRKMNTKFHTYGCIKSASKGVRLNPDEILSVARGNTVTWQKQAPTFNFKTHQSSYLSRDVRMT